MRFSRKGILPVGSIVFTLFVLIVLVSFVLSRDTAYAPVVPIELREEGGQDEQVWKNIMVSEPVPGQKVGFPLKIVGQARVFENTVQYRVVDDAGNVLTDGYGMAEAKEAGEFGTFRILLTYREPTTPTGKVEVFSSSARDGSQENSVVIPVVFSQDVSAQEILIPFVPRENEGTDCAEISSVPRRVERTPAIAHAAMIELLEGPDEGERQLFLTLLPAEARLRSVVIEEGVARVTFVAGSFDRVAGSCMVTGIRAQIEATLAQFPSVDSVIILEEGKEEGEILQP